MVHSAYVVHVYQCTVHNYVNECDPKSNRRALWIYISWLSFV